MKILLVEDELLAQEELCRLIKKNYPDAEILALIDSVDECISWLKRNQCDLILMDIHLSDGLCFEIFDEVNIETPIIFTTAYDSYAIKAFEVNSIGYILKPINEKELVKAITKLKLNKIQPLPSKLIEELLNKSSGKVYKERFLIKSGDNFSYISIIDIAYFYFDEKICLIVTKDNQEYIIDYSLDSLEPLLDSKIFFRLSRNCISSISAISSVSKYFNSRLNVKLKPEFKDKVLVSRVKVPEFLQWLDGE